ncbi:MAG: S41 family peptidase, partial [Bacteroidota bacterium]
LTLTIDGKPLDKAPQRELAAAKKDTAFDQGSGTALIDTWSQHGTRDLALLGKAWGVLKYYHPDVAAGKYNRDYELFRALPKFAAAKDKSAFLSEWVSGFGKPAKCETCSPPVDAAVVADHRWLEDESVGVELRDQLRYLIDNRPLFDKHYYVAAAPGIGNPSFKNEASYEDMPYPDVGFRYLAAVRFWNIIHYYFPYREEMDVDWADALAENIPAIVGAKDEYAYERAMTKMIGQIKDTHANLWGGNDKVQERRGGNIPPFRATFVEEKLTVVDYFDLASEPSGDAPLPGDVITHVNGKAVTDYVKEEAEYFPASNQAARLRDIGETILRSSDSTIVLTLIRDGKSSDKTVALQPLRETTGYYRWFRRDAEEPAYKMLDNNIGYLTLANVTNESYAEAKKAFKDARGIIIDIRNYPSAFGPFAFGGFLLEENTPFVKFTSMDLANPGYFTMSDPLEIPADAEPFKGKVVVLVNELSQSQAEYTAMAFRASPNTTVIGSTTAGADGNVSPIPLPGGMRTMISGLGVFYPDGEATQRVGIVPDIEMKPTIAGIRAGRDELLERAIQEILR